MLTNAVRAGPVLAALALIAGCESADHSAVAAPPWTPDPSLHDPMPPATPLPEPPLAADGTLASVWEYESANEVAFHGVTDDAGNLYWIERAPDGSGELVSFDWDGLERWRAAVPGQVPAISKLRGEVLGLGAGELLALVAGDHVLLTLPEQDGPTCARDVHLIAFRASNGTIAWRRTLGADIPPDPAFYLSCTVDARQPAASEDTLFVSVTRCTRVDDCRSSLDAFEIRSGVRRFSHSVHGQPSRPATDENGNVHVVGATDHWSELLSIAPSGEVRRVDAGSSEADRSTRCTQG
jgi:outer membrane protein assembly factor BamB